MCKTCVGRRPPPTPRRKTDYGMSDLCTYIKLVYVCIYIYIYVCMYVRMHVCVCVCDA